MDSVSQCYRGMSQDGKVIFTDWFAGILRREGFDPDSGRAFDSKRGRAFDSAIDDLDAPHDSAAENGNVYAQAYQDRANRIFDTSKSATRQQVGSAAGSRFINDNYQGRNDLGAFDKEMQAWSAKYLRAQTPGELRDCIAKFRQDHNDEVTSDSSIAHLVAYERAAERERTKPRTPQERAASARWPWGRR